MLIGICGGICAGKHSIAEYLVQQHQFLRLHLPSRPPAALLGGSDDDDDDDDDGDDIDRLLPTVTDEKGTRGLTFPDVDALLEFVTKRWREHWVLTDIWDEGTLQSLLRRPFFMLVGVDASVGVRWSRFCDRCRTRNLTPPSLEKFVQWSDRQLYLPTTTTTTTNTTNNTTSPQPFHPLSPSTSSQTTMTMTSTTPVSHLLSHAHLSVLNNLPSLTLLHTHLAHLALPSPTHLRPSWDAYFMTLASLAAQRSNCMKRRVGCVLVRSNRVISTGYNGTPRNLRNCNEGGCPRCNNNTPASQHGGALSTCLCLHAEENALLEAGRERIRDDGTSILYCDTCPCLTCSVKITQVGIGEVVFSQSYNMDAEARKIFEAGGVKLRQFSPPAKGLVDLASLGGLGLGRGEENGTGHEDELSGKALVRRNGFT